MISAGPKLSMLSESSLQQTAQQAHTMLQESNNLAQTLTFIIETIDSQIKHRKNVALIVGIVIASIIGILLLFGFVSTMMFCYYERQRGKTCEQICYGMQGGYWAFLLGGDRHDPVPNREPVVTHTAMEAIESEKV